MKNTFLLFVSFAVLLFISFVSCQKELSFENGARNGGTAKYSFGGGTGSCTGANVSGNFNEGTTVTGANKVTISVNVDSIGTYIISTDTANGITFSGSGIFTEKGVQDITLTASGTPAAAGIYNFKPATNGCTFSVTVTGGNGETNETAVYSFNGGTQACSGAVLNGVFTAGTATSAANTVLLNLKVDKVGTYAISTNSVNGIKFTGTGSFTTTGAQTVTLTASGTPTNAGTFAFTPGTNGCTFNVPVSAAGNAGGNSSGGGAGNYLRCKINGVLTNFNSSLAGIYVPPPSAGIPFTLTARGTNSDVANSVEELWVGVTNPTAPSTGTYDNRTFSMGMTDRASQVMLYPTGFPNNYWSSSVLSANTLSVKITSVSTSSATGTFQGTIYESNGIGPDTKNVTEGEFKVTY